MRVGIYIRVSTDEQAKEGFSIEAQRRILNAWAVVKGADDVVEYVDDGYSAKNLRRPAVQRLISACRNRELDVVLVWKLDRLTRDLRDLLMLMEDVFRKYGVEFVSSTESIDTSTPTGRLMLNVLGAFAQNERETNALRVKTVMMEISKGCKHLGGVPPYGYTVDADGYYQIIPEEAEVVRTIFRMKGAGESYGRIVSVLDASGIKSRSGNSFTKNTLYDMLRNEKYTGVYIYNRAAEADQDGRRNNRASKPDDQITRVEGGIPAIITHDEWKKVRSMSKEGKALGGKNTAKNIYILSGFVYCGVCGSKMSIKNGGRNRDGSYWRAYCCPNHCVSSIEYRKLESCVFDFLEMLANNQSLIDNIRKTIAEFNAYAIENFQSDSSSLRAQLLQMQRERDNLFRLASMSDDAPRSLLSEIRRRDAEIESCNRQLTLSEQSVLCIREQDVLARLDMIASIRSLPREKQKVVISEIIERITVLGDRIDISIITTADGGAEAERAVIVKILTFSIAKELLRKHRFPSRFL